MTVYAYLTRGSECNRVYAHVDDRIYPLQGTFGCGCSAAGCGRTRIDRCCVRLNAGFIITCDFPSVPTFSRGQLKTLREALPLIPSIPDVPMGGPAWAVWSMCAFLHQLRRPKGGRVRVNLVELIKRIFLCFRTITEGVSWNTLIPPAQWYFTQYNTCSSPTQIRTFPFVLQSLPIEVGEHACPHLDTTRVFEARALPDGTAVITCYCPWHWSCTSRIRIRYDPIVRKIGAGRRTVSSMMHYYQRKPIVPWSLWNHQMMNKTEARWVINFVLSMRRMHIGYGCEKRAPGLPPELWWHILWYGASSFAPLQLQRNEPSELLTGTLSHWLENVFRRELNGELGRTTASKHTIEVLTSSLQEGK